MEFLQGCEINLAEAWGGGSSTHGLPILGLSQGVEGAAIPNFRPNIKNS